MTLHTTARRRRKRSDYATLFTIIQFILSFLFISLDSCIAFTSTRPLNSFSVIESRRLRENLIVQSLFFGPKTNNQATDVPYIVERINQKPNEKVFREIAEMCINVFFKEQLNANPEDKIAPWKEAQINYLKNLQRADLARRRLKYEESNEMFLAYEVIPVTSEATAFKKPLILDLKTVENLSSADKNSGVEYVRGDLLGFCEITRRPYGLGKKQNVIYDDEPAIEPSPRPILTNLAVKKKMRKYGVGSKLLDACEQHVAQRWNLDEIILEVEDYNTRALDFYSKRGYELIFDDPASRRYDVSGLVLRKVRCTRKVFRKVFSKSKGQGPGKEDTVTIDLDFFKRIRQTVGV